MITSKVTKLVTFIDPQNELFGVLNIFPTSFFYYRRKKTFSIKVNVYIINLIIICLFLHIITVRREALAAND